MTQRRPWILAAVVLGISLAASQAFAFSMLWGWFVVPLGAQPIGVLHAYGLFFIIHLLRKHENTEEDGPGEYIKGVSRLLRWIINTWIYLGLGAITAWAAGLP